MVENAKQDDDDMDFHIETANITKYSTDFIYVGVSQYNSDIKLYLTTITLEVPF